MLGPNFVRSPHTFILLPAPRPAYPRQHGSGSSGWWNDTVRWSQRMQGLTSPEGFNYGALQETVAEPGYRDGRHTCAFAVTAKGSGNDARAYCIDDPSTYEAEHSGNRGEMKMSGGGGLTSGREAVFLRGGGKKESGPGAFSGGRPGDKERVTPAFRLDFKGV